MTQEQLDALAASLKRVAIDIATNKAPPDPPAMGSLQDLGKAVAAHLPAAATFLAGHQGVVTGIADFLAALAVDGVPYAAEMRAALLESPKLLADAEQWLPSILWTLAAFGPAPAWSNPWPQYPR